MSVEGGFKVSALSSEYVEGSAVVDSDTGSVGEAFGEISVVSGIGGTILGT